MFEIFEKKNRKKNVWDNITIPLPAGSLPIVDYEVIYYF